MDSKGTRFPLASLIAKWRTVLARPGLEEADPGPAPAESGAPGPPDWSDWQPDPLLAGFQVARYTMADRPQLPEEGPGHLVATLIRQHPPRHKRAVLHIHGWNEYFFQTHLAEFFESLGYDFYAIDLHRYGRSLLAGQLPGYMESIDEYYPELDACLELIRDSHTKVVLNGHSTGGLIAALYAAQRPKTFVGVILNSPWIDLHGSALFRALTPPIVRGLSVTAPTMVLPAAENELYVRSLHTMYQGEWDFDLGLKRVDSQPIRAGWTKAVVDGHDRVGAGLRIDCPVLVVTSTRSTSPKEFSDEVMGTDLILDVDRIAARAHLLGWHVTVVRVVGALHDVGLSRPPVRARFFDEIRRWESAYLRGKRPASRQG
jgi:alpha-beta hydrolase superfamily lysophospholipase